MSVHRDLVDLNGVAAFPADPQVEIPFEPISIAVMNQSNSDVELSFDGSEVHGTLLDGNGIEFRQRARKLWLRRTAPGAVSTLVEVIAER
jgi:hypothetical protein